MSKENILITTINIGAFFCSIFFVLGIQGKNIALTLAGLIGCLTWLMWMMYVHQAPTENKKRN